MKNITLLLLFFVAIFCTNAQSLTVQNESAINQEVSKEEAHEIIKAAAFSLMEPYMEKSLKHSVKLASNNTETFIGAPEVCFAPDTDPAIVEAFYRDRIAFQNSLDPAGDNTRFNLGPRWTSTATDGGGLLQGDDTTLTWSYVPDGTTIGNGGCNRPDQGTFSSDFITFFNGIHGPPTTAGDYTTAPWHTIFVNMFNSWSDVTGLSFVYEPNDDGVDNITGGDGVVGVRGDMRISGHRIDGNSNVLACNYFPNSSGDMVIDTADNFFSNNPGVGTINVLTHEIGHGLGIAHVCPTNQTKLMEPFVSVAFQGPQEDDILASNRHYGDSDGVNDSPAMATVLGANALPTSYSRTQRSVDDNGDNDYFSFTISEPATLTGVLTPTGSTYLNGTQNANGSCSSGTPFSASNVSNLMVEVYDTDGVTVLATGAANGPGMIENIDGTNLLIPGTYFVRVRQQTGGSLINNAQMYDIDLNIVAGLLGVEDVTPGLSTVDLFPNPANDVVTISNPQSISLKEVIIYDMAGRIVAIHDLSNSSTETTINISLLQRANYFLTIKGVEGQITKRLTKK